MCLVRCRWRRQERPSSTTHKSCWPIPAANCEQRVASIATRTDKQSSTQPPPPARDCVVHWTLLQFGVVVIDHQCWQPFEEHTPAIPYTVEPNQASTQPLDRLSIVFLYTRRVTEPVNEHKMSKNSFVFVSFWISNLYPSIFLAYQASSWLNIESGVRTPLLGIVVAKKRRTHVIARMPKVELFHISFSSWKQYMDESVRLTIMSGHPPCRTWRFTLCCSSDGLTNTRRKTLFERFSIKAFTSASALAHCRRPLSTL